MFKRKFLLFLSKLISFVIPTQKKLLVFHSSPDFADNSYAVFKYLLDIKKCKNYRYCWLFNKPSEIDKRILSELEQLVNKGFDVKFVKRLSFKGLFYLYRCRYVFYTVGLYSSISFRQNDKRINLWHGMPIKSISSSICGGDITLATSEKFATLMSNSLNIPEENVLLTGLPRNDLMFHTEFLSKDFEYLKNVSNVGIWMPTFRRSPSLIHKDGEFRENCISFVKIEELEKLNEVLQRNDALLIIKLHPYDVLQLKEFATYSNIIFLKNNNFLQKDMYPLLGCCDYLISDYSSVVIDFEILGRPIGITLDNIEEYKNTRGLNTEHIPGTYLYDTNDLVNFIESSLIHKYIDHSYGTTYNLHKDNHSTERLLSILKII